jgi:hypothetical protein
MEQMDYDAAVWWDSSTKSWSILRAESIPLSVVKSISSACTDAIKHCPNESTKPSVIFASTPFNKKDPDTEYAEVATDRRHTPVKYFVSVAAKGVHIARLVQVSLLLYKEVAFDIASYDKVNNVAFDPVTQPVVFYFACSEASPWGPVDEPGLKKAADACFSLATPKSKDPVMAKHGKYLLYVSPSGRFVQEHPSGQIIQVVRVAPGISVQRLKALESNAMFLPHPHSTTTTTTNSGSGSGSGSGSVLVNSPVVSTCDAGTRTAFSKTIPYTVPLYKRSKKKSPKSVKRSVAVAAKSSVPTRPLVAPPPDVASKLPYSNAGRENAALAAEKRYRILSAAAKITSPTSTTATISQNKSGSVIQSQSRKGYPDDKQFPLRTRKLSNSLRPLHISGDNITTTTAVSVPATTAPAMYIPNGVLIPDGVVDSKDYVADKWKLVASTGSMFVIKPGLNEVLNKRKGIHSIVPLSSTGFGNDKFVLLGDPSHEETTNAEANMGLFIDRVAQYTEGNRQKSLFTLADDLFQAACDANGGPPAVIVCGSRGGRSVAPCIWWRMWRGPVVMINGMSLLGGENVPFGVTCYYILALDDFADKRENISWENKLTEVVDTAERKTERGQAFYIVLMKGEKHIINFDNKNTDMLKVIVALASNSEPLVKDLKRLADDLVLKSGIGKWNGVLESLMPRNGLL